MRRRLLAALAVVLTAVPVGGGAQSTVNQHAWASAFAEHRVNARWLMYWELSARRHDLGASWQQQLGAVGVSRDLSPTWRATASMGWSNTYRYGETPVRNKQFELRPWVQLVGTRRLGRATWTERDRLEMRNVVGYGDLDPAGSPWTTTWRVRRMDRIVVPLRAGGAWYAAGSQEWFVLLGPIRGAANRLEQTRTQLLIGKTLSPTLRLEGGYMLQGLWRRTTDEVNHTALLVARWSAPLAR